jgi:ABC-2 type transport system permease protein
MRTLDLVLKDVGQVVRDWKTFAFSVAMPIAFTLLMGFVFGASEDADPRLPVGYLDHDGSAVSAQLLSLLQGSDVLRPEVFERGDLEKKVAREDLAAAVVVPAGYGEQIFADDPVRLAVILEPNTQAGATARNGIQTAVTRLLSGVETARLSAKTYEAHAGLASSAERQAYLEEALERATQAWRDPPVAITSTQSGATSSEEGSQAGPSGFAHSSPGSMVQFAMMGVIGMAEILVLERKSRTMQRMLTTTIPRIGVILGHWLAIFLLGLAQVALMIAFGDLVLDVGYMRQPLATGLMVVSTVLWTSTMGLLIGVLARSEEQVAMLSIIPALVLSGLGGAWMPLEFTGETFQAVGHVTPVAWAVDGFENIVVRGLDLQSVLLPAGMLLLYAAVFLALALWRFKFE